MSSTYVLSQLFIVVAYSLFGMSYIAQNRKTILVCSSCSLVAEAVGYILLFAWGGLAMVVIAAIRNLLFFGQTKLLEKRPDLKRFEWVSLAFVWLLGVVGAVITWNGILGTFAIVAGMIYAYSIWQKNDKVYDVLGIFACVFLIIYNVFIGSLFGVIMETILMLWIILATFTNVSVSFKIKKKKKD